MKKILIGISLVVLGSVGATAAHAASLSLSPSSGAYDVGDSFTVDILLNTEGTGVDGVDINVLHYDARILEIVDAYPEVDGLQIDSGALMNSTMLNTVDAEKGTILFSQVSGRDATFSSDSPERLASVTFRTKKEGTAKLRFDYQEGNTTDANVAAVGADVLTSVSGGSYEVGDRGTFMSRFLGWLGGIF